VFGDVLDVEFKITVNSAHGRSIKFEANVSEGKLVCLLPSGRHLVLVLI
jgi:hypothetical protein